MNNPVYVAYAYIQGVKRPICKASSNKYEVLKIADEYFHENNCNIPVKVICSQVVHSEVNSYDPVHIKVVCEGHAYYCRSYSQLLKLCKQLIKDHKSFKVV